VLLVALTGGIGSGKSTVAHMLSEFGAVVIDADELARAAVDRGTSGSVKVVDRFGADVLGPDSELDREALGRIVFEDEAARRDLEAIVHPEVARLFAERVEPYRPTDVVVVYDVPLLTETGMASAFDRVITVSAPEAVRAQRLAVERGMDLDEARRRMRAQASDADREAIADLVITNDGSLSDLSHKTEEVWRRLAAWSHRL
jgi:dephospho-CoA kinase